MAKTVLCADIGSSSLKAALITSEGKVLSKSRISFTDTDGTKAACQWKDSFLKAAKEAMDKAKDTSVDAICISGNGPTLVSQDGTILPWSAQVDQNGSRSLFIPRIVAFKNQFEESFNSTEYLFSGPEYLIYTLTGAAVTILPEARYEEAYWSKEALIQAGLTEAETEKLPPFVAPGHQCGTLSLEGTTSPVPVYTGAPDFLSALVGTNTLNPGDLCDRAGSSEGINLCTSVPVYGDKLRTLPSVIPGLWNVSYLLPDSGKQFSQFKARYEEYVGRETTYQDLVHDCLMSDGVFPLLDQGKYLMIQTALKVKDGIQAISIGALSTPDSLRTDDGLLNMNLHNPDVFVPNKFVTTGGQATNNEWIQMKANITGLEIDVPECEDAELLGNAVFTFTSMGLFPSIKEAASRLCQTKERISPKNEMMF